MDAGEMDEDGLETRHHPAGESALQRARRAVDGVAFRHYSSSSPAPVRATVVGSMSQGAIMLPALGWQGWLTALGLMLAVGLLVGALPARRAMRLNIVDALAGR